MSAAPSPGGPDPTHRDRWAQELASWWEHFDWLYAARRLRRPQLALVHSKSFLGRWRSAERVLELSLEHVERDPWQEVLETLRHEMAHQYAHEVLGATAEAPHGPAFQRACRILRADPRARACESGAPPVPLDTAVPEGEDRIRTRISKLLSLATSPNEHEAEVAMKKARELLVRHRLEQEEAVPSERHTFETRHLGDQKARREAWEYQLANLLQDFFFVSVIWVDSFDVHTLRRGRELEVCGTRFHLDMAQYVHGFLVQLLPRLWAEYRSRKHAPAGERVSYYAGVVAGFADQLGEHDRRTVQEVGLVVRDDAALAEHHDWLHPRVRRRAAGSVTLGSGYEDGFAEGRNVRLRKPLRSGAAKGGSRPALGPGA